MPLARRRVRSADWMGWNDVLRWLDKKNHVNLVFFFVLLASLLLNNLTLIIGMDASVGEKFSIFMGRFLTHLFLVSAVCLLVELSMRSAPKYLRWVPWLIVAMVPFLVIVDQLLGVMWNRTLFDVANALTATGRLDLALEIQTSGLDIGPLGRGSLQQGYCYLPLRSPQLVTGFPIDIKHVCPWAFLSCLWSLAGSVFWPNRASGQHGKRSQ